MSTLSEIGEGSGEYTINIEYLDGDMKNVFNEEDLQLYRWNTGTQEWKQIITSVDIENNVVVATDTQFGLFALLGEEKHSIYMPTILK